LLVIAGFLGFITFEFNDVIASGTVYVGSGPGNHTASISDAIVNFASPGDTVFVYSGTYLDNLFIDKPLNLIGEDRQTTIIDGNTDNVIYIYSTNWVNITGFTITNGRYGFYIVNTSFINVQGNEINNNLEGIVTKFSSNNTYENNIVHDQRYNGINSGYGFFFSGSPYSNNKIIGNIVYNNDGDGIHLEDETGPDDIVFWNNSIINNSVYNNECDGISIEPDGRNNYIVGNNVHHNGLSSITPRGGISLGTVYNNSIIGNLVHDNQNGILIEQSLTNLPPMYNTVVGNMVYNNDNGIRLREATDNTFIDNSIFNNNYSVNIYSQSNGNDFINNSLSNAAISNVYIESSGNNNFINCTLTNASINVIMNQQSRRNTFTNSSLSNPIKDDFNLTEDSHAILLNTTFNKAMIYYGDTFSDIVVKWFMHVKVIYYNGTPASYAEIWVNNTFGDNILNRPSDFQGWTRWIVVIEYIEQDTDGDHVGEKIFYYTPHHDTATDGTLWGYADPIMDISKVVLIILGEPPPILPPTNLTTKVVNNGQNVELEWESPISLILDHYLIYRADSQTEFDFTTPYNSSATWPNPKSTTWVDPDPSVTTVDDDFYYIVRAANFDESDISSTSNTAGVWTRTFEPGISTFSLPLEPFEKKDIEFYCQEMNASYIKWMNLTTHTWMQHYKGDSGNNTLLELGEGYEIGILGKSVQTKYTFTGMPGAMINYDDPGFLGFDFSSEAKSLKVSVQSNGNVTLIWHEPSSMISGDWYEVYYSNTRDGFFGILGMDYDLAGPSIGFGTNSTTIAGLGGNDPGAKLYFMVVPFNTSGVRGSSTYSIGVWTEEYLAGYDTVGIPLKQSTYKTADRYCDNIPDTVGINYFIYSGQRWGWHSTRMPNGAYDPILVMAEGYQISTSGPTKFTFIGN
jgi:parallel beta-helix repeat protein